MSGVIALGTFYLDCEWNDWRGDLISLALVPVRGEEFYVVLPCERPSRWVEANVLPVLSIGGPLRVHYAGAQQALQSYLSHYDCATIITDWPEDIAHFCRLLITGPGERIAVPHLTFVIDREAGDKACKLSKVPHNALSDARALRDVCMELMEA